MSRSYKKYILQPICCGNNGPWYKQRRRLFRRSERNKFRELLAHNEIDDVSDMTVDPKLPKKDQWREPTDGGTLVYSGMKENKKWFDVEWLMNKWGKYLKPKENIKYTNIKEHITDYEPKI